MIQLICKSDKTLIKIKTKSWKTYFNFMGNQFVLYALTVDMRVEFNEIDNGFLCHFFMLLVCQTVK